MGIAVSNWQLARTVSMTGELGVVSGVALDQVLARRLQDGDPAGDIRRAVSNFPFPEMARRVLDTFFIEGGRKEDSPYKPIRSMTVKSNHWLDEICIVANFVEVFLAREGHSNPVGINYLEKIQLPHLPSLYGALLAGVSVVIVGAGIPLQFSGIIDQMIRHEHAEYAVNVHGALPSTDCKRRFDPTEFVENGNSPQPLRRPAFLPIISSDSLATMLLRKSEGTVDGFVIETSIAGGHNAPPRGKMTFSPDGEPIYGPRDICNLDKIREVGLPFWLGGGYGSPEGLKKALDEGAAGVQVGTAFALCRESGMQPALRTELLQMAQNGRAEVFTDACVSPAGFPFKVAQLPGTVSDKKLDAQRCRICDMGYLRTAYQRDDGKIGWRCPAEPEETFLAKGGRPEEIEGRACVCNSLFATVGLGQIFPNGSRALPIVTLGDDYVNIGRICEKYSSDYSARDVVAYLNS